MITGRQIREARRLLKWAQWRLANKAHVVLNTVARAEGEDGVPQISAESLARIEAALKAGGVEFIPVNGGEEGVRLRNGADPS